ncbi:MAG: transposase [Deltaproteobacteria bacterium]|nr:transposase [Deltaproteobacteria bacterium]
MPRIARAVVKDYPYHVTQRGNYRQPVFEVEDDFLRYKVWLKEYSQKYRLKVSAYCLMSNHVHFVCVPLADDALARTFNTLHMRYSRYFHNKKGLKGHLWQGRSFSCALDERHLRAAVRYVENNPVRAKIVDSLERYKWSSTLGHMNRGTDPILSGSSPICDHEERVFSSARKTKLFSVKGVTTHNVSVFP